VTMPAIARAAKQPSAPAVRDEAPEVPPIAPAARTLGVTSQEEPANKTAPRSPRRPLVRGGLFPLLQLALIAGANWYVTGGQVMSTDDAYVEAEKVGISTDVSGRRNAKRAKSAPAALANSARGRGGTSVPFRLAAGSAPWSCWFTSRRFFKAIFQGDEGRRWLANYPACAFGAGHSGRPRSGCASCRGSMACGPVASASSRCKFKATTASFAWPCRRAEPAGTQVDRGAKAGLVPPSPLWGQRKDGAIARSSSTCSAGKWPVSRCASGCPGDGLSMDCG
jgi:hypothetical protein